ncbi:S26 family signal peptidase [Salinirarus marinus]|uniref:S26 family signal peptidase n=1 Tax=Salinirarus marinus TaxID=3068310 RepID=UPI003C6C27E9
MSRSFERRVGDADWWPFVRDAGKTLLSGVLLLCVLFAITGVWPPLVAVESGSMAPNVRTGDMLVVGDRFASPGADEAGVLTARRAAALGATQFGAHGDVIVFSTPNRTGPPVVHRAVFHVAAGENWYARADPAALPAGVENCADLPNCPAPNAGYVTRGDAAPTYDQATGAIPPAARQWVRARALVRIPYLGWIRLLLAGG